MSSHRPSGLWDVFVFAEVETDNLKYNERRQAYEFPCKLRGESRTLYIITEDDDEQAVLGSLDEIRDKLDRINRNKDKIAKILYDQMVWADEDKPEIGFSDSYEEFADELYIARYPCADVDRDGVTVSFSVRSRKDYRLDPRLDFTLYPDNSFEYQPRNCQLSIIIKENG